MMPSVEKFLRKNSTYELQVHQGVLENALSSIFTSGKVIKEARKDVHIINPDTGDYLEVDIWYPELSLCFEFQDDYHYLPTWRSQVPLASVQDKDRAKREVVLKRGETLITIPCWWDGSLVSLQATIGFLRPDVLPIQNSHDAIPFNPPLSFFPAMSVPENIQLMLASFPSFPSVEISDQNPWWVGEKYDGVRCYWSPTEKQLYSRHRMRISIPNQISSSFGYTAFDAEIWCGRGLFAESYTVALSNEKANWSLFRMVCFDEVSEQMNQKAFERRYLVLLSHYTPDHPSIIVASRFLCSSHFLLSTLLESIMEGGGEGLVMRQPKSRYIPGRSSSLFKLKGTRRDQEALVVHVGEEGSLTLQLPSGKTFIVPKEDCVLFRRALRGDVVTFTHGDSARHKLDAAPLSAEETPARTRGVAPLAHAETQESARNARPIVFRIRGDVSWGDVLLQYKKDVNQEQEKNVKKQKYSSYERQKIMRGQLETAARTQGFDPLVAENWYSVSRQKFSQHKEIGPVIKHYGSSLIRALIDLFPELHLQIDKFASTPHKFWDNINNRRELFKKFAISKGGNPLDSRFWLSVKPKLLHNFKGMSGVMVHYKGFYDAIMHLFPELHLTHTSKLWTFEDQKSFFDKFALSKNFDPLIPNNWYSVSHVDLSNIPEFKRILRHFGGELADCLLQLYPNIGLQKSKFGVDVQAEREILNKFALAKGGDTLHAQFWYSLNPLELRKFKSSREVVRRYGGYHEAVMRLFPDLKLRRSRFSHQIVPSWASEKDRRDFFDKIAAAEGFDPLVPYNWYKISPSTLMKYTGYKRIIYHYYGKLSSCLMQLYPDIGLQQSKFPKYHKTKKRDI